MTLWFAVGSAQDLRSSLWGLSAGGRGDFYLVPRGPGRNIVKWTFHPSGWVQCAFTSESGLVFAPTGDRGLNRWKHVPLPEFAGWSKVLHMIVPYVRLDHPQQTVRADPDTVWLLPPGVGQEVEVVILRAAPDAVELLIELAYRVLGVVEHRNGDSALVAAALRPTSDEVADAEIRTLVDENRFALPGADYRSPAAFHFIRTRPDGGTVFYNIPMNLDIPAAGP